MLKETTNGTIIEIMQKSWTLIRGNMQNMGKKYFLPDVPKVLIFDLLTRTTTMTINDYQ